MATRKDKRAARRVTTTPEATSTSTTLITTFVGYRLDGIQEGIHFKVRPYHFMNNDVDPGADGKTIIAESTPGGEVMGLLRVRDGQLKMGDADLRVLEIICLSTFPGFESSAVEGALLRWLLSVVDLHNVVLWRAMEPERAFLLGNRHAIVSAIVIQNLGNMLPKTQQVLDFGKIWGLYGAYSLIPGMTVLYNQKHSEWYLR